MCSTIARSESEFMKSFLLIILLIIPTVSWPQSRTPLIQSIDIVVPVSPTPVMIAGKQHLGYELHITNFRNFDIALTHLEILNADNKSQLGDFRDSELNRMLGRPGVPDLKNKQVLGPGMRAVVFLWLPLNGTVTSKLYHRIEFDLIQSTGREHGVVDFVSDVRKDAPVVLHPPLKGGPWVALYDPQMERGHRTSVYTLNGHARIPARFAIDWIRLKDDASHAQGDDSKISNWYGYGAEVLAVADAVVTEAMDDISEDAMLSATKVSLENASGNYIALDLGNGRYGFYEHLKHGSIKVKRGDRVKSGQVIAQLGNSGSSSSGPHLHFHVSDASSELAAEGLPYVFTNFEVIGAYESIGSFANGELWKPASNGGNRTMELPAPNTVIKFL
jgi:Peptidase family M23